MELRTECQNRWLMAEKFPSRTGRNPHLHPPSAVNYFGSICGSSPKPLAHAVGQQCIARGSLASASASVQVELSKSTAGRGTHWPHTLAHTLTPTHTYTLACWLVCCDHRHQWLTHVASMPFGPKICPHMAICVWREGVWLPRGRDAGAASNDKVEHRTH